MKTKLFDLIKAIAAALLHTRLRYLPGARPAYALAYRLLAPDEIRVVGFKGGQIYVNPRDTGIALPLVTEGIYEPGLSRYLERVLEPGMAVVDGGANVGYFTLLAAKLVGDLGRVYAFEPSPESFDLLERSIDLNGYGNVIATRSALSDRSAVEQLHLHRNNLGNPSLQAANVSDRVGAVEVRTTSLDEFFAREPESKVDLIKLDTQGAEGLVLAGAERLLASQGLRIVIEFWPWGLRNMGSDPLTLLQDLRAKDFGVAWLDERTGDLKPCDDADVIADCEGREGGRGFVTLGLQR